MIRASLKKATTKTKPDGAFGSRAQ